MKRQEYRPEGIPCEDDAKYLSSVRGLEEAMHGGKILQARCKMCDAFHNLHLDIAGVHAIIPRQEAALGIADGTVKDVAIITRVNKMVSFKVVKVVENEGQTVAYLSRRLAQQECQRYIFDNFMPGDIIDAKVTHLEQFGAFVDVGCGIISMIAIDNISVSRINHPKDRFSCGMDIKAVIKSIDYDSQRIVLSHKELLGTWQQNVQQFSAGQTVSGIVRSIESYGIFIELTPNLAGLAECVEGVRAGQCASVFIKSIIPEKMKVKLAIVDVSDEPADLYKLEYKYTGDSIKNWRYSPENCLKTVESVFE